LAARAVVGFVVGVADALDVRAADRAGLTKFSVDGEVRTERGHVTRTRETRAELLLQTLDPKRQRGPAGIEQPRDLRVADLLRERHGREPGGVKNLVGVG